VQTSGAQVLRRLVLSKQDLLDADRQDLVAFLSQSSGYAPQGGEIVGILKQMEQSSRSPLLMQRQLRTPQSRLSTSLLLRRKRSRIH